MVKVSYKNTGDSIEVEAGSSLKDIIDNQGWPVPFGCSDGLCGTCVVKISQGIENTSEPEEKEKITLEAMGLDSSEFRLSCQCKVNGEIEIETM